MFRLALPLLIVALLPARVFALAGDLERPGIAAHAGDDLVAIMAALNNERHEYAGGSFLNSFSTMHFRGDAQDVAMFVDDLSKIENVTVHVRFSKEAGTGRNLEKEFGPCQWRVTHHPAGTTHEFGVTIFLGDGTIDLEELRLPPIRGAAPAPAPADE